uniref:Protein kinase domain-containing protein n=1 Tax=Aegilops tauschii subsp. strangulata TaxID=200361 RepID=A0A453SEL3_AEGTS
MIKEFVRFTLSLQELYCSVRPRHASIFLGENILLKIADFCLSSCLEEKQSQAIASKQFGSMYERRDIDELGWIYFDLQTCLHVNIRYDSRNT